MDSLAVLGNVLEEFMDLAPKEGTLEYDDWREKRERVERALEENGLRYYRFGRVLPQGDVQPLETFNTAAGRQAAPSKPARVEELLEVMVRGLRRAMHPLTHRRKGTQPLSFGSEYYVQDLLHALLRPWINDIRPEEFTPSYAGSRPVWTSCCLRTAQSSKPRLCVIESMRNVSATNLSLTSSTIGGIRNARRCGASCTIPII